MGTIDNAGAGVSVEGGKAEVGSNNPDRGGGADEGGFEAREDGGAAGPEEETGRDGCPGKGDGGRRKVDGERFGGSEGGAGVLSPGGAAL